MNETASHKEERYKIGAVERLTGIPASSIRIWERRYGTVQPARSESGTRYYSGEDVARLKLIRELTELGDAVSEVAQLNLAALKERRREFGQTSVTATNPTRNILLVGDFDPQLAELLAQRDGVEQVMTHGGHPALSTADEPADLVLISLPTLHRDQVSELHALRRRTGAHSLIVICNFVNRECREAAASPEVRLVRGPLSAEEMADLLPSRESAPGNRFTVEAFLDAELPPVRFSRDQLVQVGALESRVQCECPHHLADLISDLQAFEQYSAECESRSAEDAQFHARLHRGSALCRSVLEALLSEALEHEKIKL